MTILHPKTAIISAGRGALDLHKDTGLAARLAALHKCSLWEFLREYARYEGEELIIADKNVTELVHMRGGEKEGPFGRPEIDRERLKEIILETVPGGDVRWGWDLREVTKDGMLRFDGREEMEGPYDVIVSADGAWSKVRARLNELIPAYARFGAGICVPEGEAKETLDKHAKKGRLKMIPERHADWAPEMTKFLRQGDLDGLKHWSLYELPVGCKLEHKKGFTLIGDVVSLMTPSAGKRVNKAIKDSLEPAEPIEKSQDPSDDLKLDQAVLLYEQLMFPRAEKFKE